MAEKNEIIQRSTKISHVRNNEQLSTIAHPVKDSEIDTNDIEPREHIKEIRKALGTNADPNNEDQAVVNNLKDLLRECLKKLADDLYSDQGHFVLELIQNADDNDYSNLTNNSVPKLKFIINNKQITVYNNENGFQKQHIQAICAVGKSTKGMP